MRIHFFWREPLDVNLIPSFTVILLLLFVLHFDNLELSLLSFDFFFLSLYSRIEESLSSIPKYSCITFDSFAPSFGCYFVMEDKGIFQNSFKLFTFLIFNFPVDLFLFDFNIFYGFRKIYSLKLFFLPIRSKWWKLSYLKGFLKLQLLILLFDLEYTSGYFAGIVLLIFLSISYFFENNFFSDFFFLEGDLSMVFDFLRIQLLEIEFNDLIFLLLVYGLCM